MRDNNTSNWSQGLGFVQWSMNTCYHEAIKMSPYQAMFGGAPRCGLGTTVANEFLKAVVSTGVTEEDFENLIGRNIDDGNNDGNDGGKSSHDTSAMDVVVGESVMATDVVVGDSVMTMDVVVGDSVMATDVVVGDSVMTMDVVVPLTDIDGNDVGSDTELNNMLTEFDELTAAGPSVDPTEKHPAVALREIAAENLVQQANRMLLRARGKLPKVVVGDNVAIPVPEFDRGRGDPANIVGVVMKERDGKFKIGTKHGVIENFMERNSFDLSKYRGVKVEDVCIDTVTSIRNLVRLGSVGSGQGYRRCACSQACTNKRCKCYKDGYECNSACHPNNSTCCNKHE